MTTSATTTIPEIRDTASVYDNYKKVISELIANIEVYEHDLPGETMVQIAELFQSLAVYETDPAFAAVPENWDSFNETHSKVVLALYKHTISLLIKKIYEYKKLFKKYKYKGVMLEDGTKFCIIASSKEKDISKAYAEQLRLCYKGKHLKDIWQDYKGARIKYFRSSFSLLKNPSFRKLKEEPYLQTDDLNINMQLPSVFEDTKALLALYQTVSSDVISNGTKQPWQASIFIALLTWVIPIILAIPVVSKIVNIIKNLFCN